MLSQQKSRLVFFDIVINNIVPCHFYHSHYELNKQAINDQSSVTSWIQTHNFLWATLFFNSASVFLNFSSVGRQMLRKCYLIHININIPRDFLCLVYLCLFLGFGLSILYLCDLIMFFSIFTNNIQKTCLKKANSFQIANVQQQGVLFSFCLLFANFNLVLLAWVFKETSTG